MRVEYSADIDAAYIYLDDRIADGAVTKTFLCPPHEVGFMINLDFDAQGRLLGIEIVDHASECLPKSLLDKAEPPKP